MLPLSITLLPQWIIAPVIIPEACNCSWRCIFKQHQTWVENKVLDRKVTTGNRLCLYWIQCTHWNFQLYLKHIQRKLKQHDVSSHRHFQKSPRNGPWNRKTQMYVHMFTCKQEPWLVRRSSAAVTNSAWLMEVPSLAGGEDKQPIAAPEPLCMTLRTGDVQVNGPKASISSALHHLARLRCQNHCLLAFIFNSQRMTTEIYVTFYSLPLSLEMTGSLEIQLSQRVTLTWQKPSTIKAHVKNLAFCF